MSIDKKEFIQEVDLNKSSKACHIVMSVKKLTRE